MCGLKNFRTSKNLKQSDLKEIFGCTQSMVSRIENGRDPMPLKFIQKLTDIYGEEVAKYFDTNPFAISDNGSNSIVGNNNHHINANTTLEMAIKEISEQRKLVSKSQEQLSKSQEQIDRLITLLEKK